MVGVYNSVAFLNEIQSQQLPNTPSDDFDLEGIYVQADRKVYFW